MTDPMSDDERLAALIDGRLDERQRAELLERLALSEEDLEVLAEAGTITRELEEEDRAAAAADQDAGVIPLPARRRTPRYRRWMPIAAVLAGVALGGTFWMAGLGGRRGSPVAIVDRLANADHPPPVLPDPWDRTRGGPAPEGFARGVRLGALLADLQLAAARRDQPAVQAAAASVANLLTPVPDASSALGFYEDLRLSTVPPDHGALGKRATEVARAAGEDAVRLGSWARTAQAAAAIRRADFFGDARRELDRFAGARGLPAEAAGAVRAVKADLPGAGPPDWPRLSGDLAQLLQAAGS